MSIPIILSKSSFKTYKTCPKKYFFKYVEYRKEDLPDVVRIGSDVHEWYNHFFDYVKIDNGFDVSSIPIPEDPKVAELCNTIIEYERGRYQKCIQSKDPKKYYYPIMREIRIDVPSRGIKGIVDAVFINMDDNEYVATELKTGNIVKDPEIREELLFYKLLLDNSGKLDKPIKWLYCLFPKVQETYWESVDSTYAKRSLAKLDKEIEAIKVLISIGKFDPVMDPFKCKYCSFNSICWNNGIVV